MILINYIFWIIIVPIVLAYLGVKILKKGSWLIISIEVCIVLFLTLIDIIESYPVGNMQGQLSSYFGNVINNFYVRYIPFIVITIIFIKFFKKQRIKVK